MEKIDETSELRLKTSRISFISNYFIAVLVLIFTVLAINAFDLQFSLLPETRGELVSTLIILGLFGIAAALIEQPEIVRFMRQYIITFNEVIEVEGIISKKKIILPYGSISEVTVRKSPIGRMLNYGDVYVGAFRTGSDINIKGVKNASKVHEIIQNRINMIREGQITFFGKKEETTEKKKK